MFIADTHVHFYPGYDLKVAFNSFLSSMNLLAPRAIKGMFLAERHDCCFFSDLKSGRIAVPDGFQMEETLDQNVLLIKAENGDSFYVFAGRQIVTAERIEILALTSDLSIEDGQSAIDVICRVSDAGAVPVLAWALGKWMFGRKRIVMDLIRSLRPDKLVIGDSIMRPQLWSEPDAMRYAAEKRFAILAGTDPLPFAKEEKYIGTYASVMQGDFDRNQPGVSARKLLRDPRSRRVGKRCNPVVLMMRQVKI